MSSQSDFHDACRHLESLLSSDTRHEVISDLLKSRTPAKALMRLRDSMRSGIFKTGSGEIRLNKIIKMFDSRNALEGFHVLQDWDGKADRLNKDLIPVDVLEYVLRGSQVESSGRTVPSILLDYYLLYVLALLSLRAWDDGNADGNLNRLSALLELLQGPGGSGHQFAGNGATLILIATSHFEPDIRAYERLLDKVRTLNQDHRIQIALAHSAILSSHLRHGFEGFYGRDIAQMRDDNVPDYPWLCFSLTTLMNEYSQMCDGGIHGVERERIVEGILNGLCPDARAFIGKSPAALAAYERELAEFRRLFQKYNPDLFKEFENHRPSEHDYSPLSFTFNFPHNLVKAVVIDALSRGEPWRLTMNDLLTGIPLGEPLGKLRAKLANTLAGYARSSPEIVRGRSVPAISYDPPSGLRNFAKTIGIIRNKS